MTPSKNNSGFTLIETLLYAALLSLIVGGMIGTTYEILRNSESISAHIAATEDANFILKKIKWALTQDAVTFDMNGSDIRIRKGTDTPIVLNGAQSVVSSLSFEHVTSPDGIRTNLIINGISFTAINYLLQ